jgi:hypothetical protein
MRARTGDPMDSDTSDDGRRRMKIRRIRTMMTYSLLRKQKQRKVHK